jgi:hypothetical protein
VVELPVFDIPIVHEEVLYPMTADGASGAVTPLDISLYRKRVEAKKLHEDPFHFDPLELVPFLDYENERDNPVEDKYRTLAHDLLRGLVDPGMFDCFCLTIFNQYSNGNICCNSFKAKQGRK